VQRDALYYAATAQYRLQQYVEARKSLQMLLQVMAEVTFYCLRLF
jgi:hypothetical protein